MVIIYLSLLDGYYQPAGPLIKEGASDTERALARYHPPHYHPPHPPVLQQYAGPYYPADLCYGRYYRPPGPYHMPPPPQTDAQVVPTIYVTVFQNSSEYLQYLTLGHLLVQILEYEPYPARESEY
ncbi:hypothetical protein EVAR_4017_1 [Eumeta japonica]|uniref:Uncharacterized protein n=1 Tax=Eumeta variegata TaxID=151549 RepID=A0A4C1T4V2_EUMVA|nr:hypothetical protein EVAR_4017_1 [Eumeta japonica]